jgi:hypothetical protein
MCDKCLELDKKIERYHRLQFGINDQFAKEGLEQLIRGSDGSKARFASRVEASKAVANVTPAAAATARPSRRQWRGRSERPAFPWSTSRTAILYQRVK